MKNKYLIGISIVAVSAIGVQWTQEREGTVLKPYYDSGRVATIGTGTTVYPNGQKVKITDPPITKKQATEFLQYHMKGDVLF
jgi:GH24 family phage-related lysozyme (muramidase)